MRRSVEPARGAGDGAALAVQKDEALGVAGQQLGGQPLQGIGALAGRVPGRRQDEIGLPDGFFRPGGELGIGEIQHVVRAAFERVQRAGGFRAVERRAGGQDFAGALRVEQQGVGPERAHQALDEQGRQRAVAGADQGQRARPGVGRRRPAEVGLRHAARERHGERAPDGRALGGQGLEVGPPEAQHQAVAQRGDGRGAGAAGQEGDLADRLSRSQLRNRDAAAVQRHDEAPGHHDIEGIGRLALPDQGFAALQAQRIEFGRQPRPLVRGQVVEDLDRIEAMPGGVL